MEGTKDKLETYGIAFFYIIYLVGIAGHIFSYTRSLMIFLTPYTLALSSIILIYFLTKESDKRIYLWFLSTYLITFSLEVVGVKTGLVFGTYNYGEVLGLKLLETPLIIGLNWVFVIFGAYFLAHELEIKKYLVPLVTAILALSFDYFMEPVAINLEYWTWENNIIPLQNYLAWFIISFLFASILNLIKIRVTNKIFSHYFVIQFMFFVILNMVLI